MRPARLSCRRKSALLALAVAWSGAFAAACARHTVTLDPGLVTCTSGAPLALDLDARCTQTASADEIGATSADCILGDTLAEESDASLRIVEGSLRIQNTSDVEFPNLEFVGGCVSIESVGDTTVSFARLSDTREVSVTSGAVEALSLPALVTGDVTVRGAALTTLSLPAHDVGVVAIDDAPALTTVALHTLAGGLSIAHAPVLQTIEAPRLTSASALRIEDTAAEVVDVDAVTDVDEFAFVDNPSLTRVALSSLTRVRALLRIDNNGASTSALCAVIDQLRTSGGLPDVQPDAIVVDDCFR